MAKAAPAQFKPYTPAEFQELRGMIEGCTSAELAALKLGRYPAPIPENVVKFCRYHADRVLQTRPDAKAAEANHEFAVAIRKLARVFQRRA